MKSNPNKKTSLYQISNKNMSNNHPIRSLMKTKIHNNKASNQLIIYPHILNQIMKKMTNKIKMIIQHQIQIQIETNKIFNNHQKSNINRTIFPILKKKSMNIFLTSITNILKNQANCKIKGESKRKRY